MKNLIFVFAILSIILSAQLALSQVESIDVNYKKIQKSIQEKESPFFFPSLFHRFNANDTTLSLIEYHYLYYGYTYDENYNPYFRSENIDKINAIYQRKNPSKKDFQELIKLNLDILSKSPFNLDAILAIMTGYEQLNEIEMSRVWYYKYDKIITTILSSGDGLSEETAMHVITTHDEYVIISVLGFNFGGSQSLIKGNYDLLTLEKNDYGVNELYFDVNRLFDHLMSK